MFQGRTGGEGLTLTCPGETLALPGGEACRRPFSRLSTRHLVPSKMKVAAECCPSGAEVGTCVAPQNRCRNRSATTSVFEGGGGDREGPVAPLSWGPRARFWACGTDGPSQGTRLTRSLPRKRKSRQSPAVLGPRCGRVPQTGTSDGIAPRRFSFSRGRTGKGLTLTCSGALVHRPRQDWADGPSQPLTRLDSSARSLENESRGLALPFWE